MTAACFYLIAFVKFLYRNISVVNFGRNCVDNVDVAAVLVINRIRSPLNERQIVITFFKTYKLNSGISAGCDRKIIVTKKFALHDNIC